MGIFNSTRWTGGDVADVVTLPKPEIKSEKVEARSVLPGRAEMLDEYAELAQLVGVTPPDLGVESFKDFLRKKDWPVFPLDKVIAYMDKKALTESKDKAGWEWRPLREKDHIVNAELGWAPVRNSNGYHTLSGDVQKAASDYYSGPKEFEVPETVIRTASATGGGSNGGVAFNGTIMVTAGTTTVHSWMERTGRMTKSVGNGVQNLYDKTIPLHALRKVATIEKEFISGKAHFFVCDYAVAPHIVYPDPFLMVMIDNPALKNGTGRFVIDFWDEPGFGLEKML